MKFNKLYLCIKITDEQLILSHSGIQVSTTVSLRNSFHMRFVFGESPSSRALIIYKS